MGPVCPIYGIGGLLITFLLERYTSEPFVLFIMSILVCGTLEYFTSYIMEKFFHARWWDYSNYKYNINGRVCLNTIIPFGILGLLIMYVANPFFIGLLKDIPSIYLTIISIVIALIFLVDIIISTKVISYLGKTTKEVGKDLDNTEEITKKVKEILLNKSGLYRRFLNAYPAIQSLKVKVKEKQEQIKNQINKQTEDIKYSISKQKEELKNELERKKKFFRKISK